MTEKMDNLAEAVVLVAFHLSDGTLLGRTGSYVHCQRDELENANVDVDVDVIRFPGGAVVKVLQNDLPVGQPSVLFGDFTKALDPPMITIFPLN